MFRKRSLGLALLLSAAIGILIPGSVHATAIADSQAFFSNLQIIPATGNVVFLDSWAAEALVQGTNFQGQFDFSLGGEAKADLGKIPDTFIEAHAFASAQDKTASASSHGNISGAITAQALSKGAGHLFNTFMLIGGPTGQTETVVTISANFSGSLNVSTDAFGREALAEAGLFLEIDGNEFAGGSDFQRISAIGTNSTDSLVFSKILSGQITLPFNTPSFLFVDLDPETEVNNRVPEPSTMILMLAGLILLAGFGCRKA
jgi:hypothetical protein